MSKAKSFLVSSMYLKPRKPKATPKPPTTPPPPHLKEAGAAWGRLGPGPSGATGETAGVAVYSNDPMCRKPRSRRLGMMRRSAKGLGSGD